MARLEEKVKLPSNGILYGKSIPGELTIKNMTVDEESLLYGSTNDKAIDNILSSIIDEDIDVNSLIAPDKHFLLVRTRILTYGNIYPLEVTCPKCGQFHYDLDLNTLPVTELDPKFVDSWEITLPQCKSRVKLRIPTGNDMNEMEVAVKRKSNKFGINLERAMYIGGLAINISKIDDEDVLFDEAYQFIHDLSGMDSSYFKKHLNEVDVGYDTLITVNCPKCGEEIKFRLPMTGDFFRAQFDE